MTEISFLDSNIVVYAFDKRNTTKQEKAFDLLRAKPSISSQIIIESYNVCSRKLKMPSVICDENVLTLTDLCFVKPITESIVSSAIDLKNKYHFSFLDSMVVATAMASNCNILYSEDMQHNQIIENSLTIINPFVQFDLVICSTEYIDEFIAQSLEMSVCNNSKCYTQHDQKK